MAAIGLIELIGLNAKYRLLKENQIPKEDLTLHPDFFSEITQYLAAEDRVLWKSTCKVARDAASWEEVQMIRTTFAQSMAYLHRIAEPTKLFCLDKPGETLSQDLASVNKKAAFLAKCAEPVDKILSPLIVPWENNLLPVIYHAYFEAIRFLRESDKRLIDFFKRYLKSHRESIPPFMEEELEVPKMAQKIRQHLADQQYRLKYLEREDRGHFFLTFPPELPLYFRTGRSDDLSSIYDRKIFEEMRVEYRFSGKSDEIPHFEFFFSFIETGKWSCFHWNGSYVGEEEGPKLMQVFDRALRIDRRGVANTLFPLICNDWSLRFKFTSENLKKYARIASRHGNEELVELIRERYKKSISVGYEPSVFRFILENIKFSLGYWQGGAAKSGKDLKKTAVIRENPQWRQFKGDDQELVTFFKTLFKEEDDEEEVIVTDLPDFMREETDVASKANRIRKEMIRQNYSLRFGRIGEGFPIEVVYFRMTLDECIHILNDTVEQENFETFFALIESGKLESISQQENCSQSELPRLKDIFFITVVMQRASCVEILLRIIGKDLTRDNLKEAELGLASSGGNQEISNLLKQYQKSCLKCCF